MFPTLYEINTRIWLKQFGPKASLADIPDQYWEALKEKGIDYVWLMGIWMTTESSIEKCCFHPDLIQEYDRVSPNWQKEDITGSPYAIEDYVLDKRLGQRKDLVSVRRQLNRIGLRLILDFVPNHFNVDSNLVKKHPKVFLQVTSDQFYHDTDTFFQKGDQYFAHGKDPYFAAWSDTAQINYLDPEAHNFMRAKLSSVADYCDGVRCDMAMLILPDIFENTWGQISSQRYPVDFWTHAIAEVKKKNPEFIFMAEAYWDTEWRLHTLGFDYTYDKKMLDFLVHDQIWDLKKHLTGLMDYHKQTVRFIENHDEDRSLRALGECKAKAAAILYNTLPGMRLHYDGQWTGERVRYPVQVGTYFTPQTCICAIRSELSEQALPCSCMKVFYDQLLKIASKDIFKLGEWKLLNEDSTNPNISMIWTYLNKQVLVAINLTANHVESSVQVPGQWEGTYIIDILNQVDQPNYVTKTDTDLKITLPPYKGCILSDQKSKLIP